MDISEVGKGLYISNTNKATTCSTGKGLRVHGIALGDNEELGYSLFSDVPSPSLLPYFDLLTLHRSRDKYDSGLLAHLTMNFLTRD